MRKCKRCGRYNDPSEYPEGVEFDPELCITCLRNTAVQDDEEEDTPEETDDDPEGVRAAEEAEEAEKELEEEDDENVE